MYTIRFVALSSGELAEILPDALESAAFVVEERFALVLLELLGDVCVVDAEVVYSTDSVEAELMRGNLLPPAA